MLKFLMKSSGPKRATHEISESEDFDNDIYGDIDSTRPRPNTSNANRPGPSWQSCVDFAELGEHDGHR
jgi:hypothetical protein